MLGDLLVYLKPVEQTLHSATVPIKKRRRELEINQKGSLYYILMTASFELPLIVALSLSLSLFLSLCTFRGCGIGGGCTSFLLTEPSHCDTVYTLRELMISSLERMT